MRPFLFVLIAGLALGACDQTPIGIDTASVASDNDLPDGLVYNEFNRNYYEAVAAQDITWSEAAAAVKGQSYRQCEAHLAVLTSENENAWVAATFPEAVEGGYWLGGTQAPGETDPAAGWSWATGEPFLYTNWNAITGEPNDFEGRDEESLHFLPPVYFNTEVPAEAQFGSWNDQNGDDVPFLFLNEDGETEALVNGYVVEYECPTKVTGGGRVVREDVDSSVETYGLNAQKRPDASVQGQAELHFQDFDARLHVEVSCLSVWDNEAWVGGTVTRSDNPDFPAGIEGVWRVVDNGQGADAEPDRISDVFLFDAAAQVCATQPGIDTFEWDNGNVRVH